MNELIFAPQEAAKLAYDALERLKETRGTGVKTGIVSLDNVLLPMQPAELIVVLGYTSWYKSGMMNWLLRAALKQSVENEICIKATWEDSVEEETLKWLSAEAGISISDIVRGAVTDYDALDAAYIRRIKTPLWIVGHSNQRSELAKKSRPRMTMTDVTKAIDFIQYEATDNKYKAKLIVLDYLQRIRPDASDGNTKREQMMEAVNKAKDLAIQMGCPVILGVQASRNVLERDYKLPRLDDGSETSNIEQSSDKVLSLWYPIKTEEPGVLIAQDRVTVNENLLILGVLKQKMGIAPVTIPLYVDPTRNLIAGMELPDGRLS